MAEALAAAAAPGGGAVAVVAGGALAASTSPQSRSFGGPAEPEKGEAGADRSWAGRAAPSPSPSPSPLPSPSHSVSPSPSRARSPSPQPRLHLDSLVAPAATPAPGGGAPRNPKWSVLRSGYLHVKLASKSGQWQELYCEAREADGGLASAGVQLRYWRTERQTQVGVAVRQCGSVTC
jgi:hypothetical protein